MYFDVVFRIVQVVQFYWPAETQTEEDFGLEIDFAHQRRATKVTNACTKTTRNLAASDPVCCMCVFYKMTKHKR